VTACEGEAPDFRLTVTGLRRRTGHRVREHHRRHRVRALRPGRETQLYGTTSTPTSWPSQDLESMLKDHNVVRPSTGLPPSGSASYSAWAAATGTSATSTAPRSAAGRSKEAIEVANSSPAARCSSSTSTCGCTATGEPDLLAGPGRTPRAVHQGHHHRSPQEGRQAPRPGRGHHHGPADEVAMALVILLRRHGAVEGHPGHGRHPGHRANKYGFINAAIRPSTRSALPAGASSPARLARTADLEDCASSGGAAAMKALAFLRRKPVSVA